MEKVRSRDRSLIWHKGNDLYRHKSLASNGNRRQEPVNGDREGE